MWRNTFPLRQSVLAVAAFLFCWAGLSAFQTGLQGQNQVGRQVQSDFNDELANLEKQTQNLLQTIALLEQKKTTSAQVQQRFREVKLAYKQTEFLIEYLNPDLARKLNSGPIPKVVVHDADYQALANRKPQFETLPPYGLQVLEEVLFEEQIDTRKAHLLTDKLAGEMQLFAHTLHNLALTDKQVLEAMREQLIRAMTMGISGFDSPAGGHEIDYVSASLEPLLKAAKLFRNTSTGEAKTQAGKSAELLQQSLQYVQQNPGFGQFNRAHFIRNLADPAYGALSSLQQVLFPAGSNQTLISKPVNDRATSLFSTNFLLPGYYAKQDRQQTNPEIVELGKTLFFDPVLSSNNQRACASCHAPDKAFTDAQARSLAFDAKGNVTRNSPTLLNSVFSTAYFWDSRAGFLEDQIPFVVTKADELHTSYEDMVHKLNQSADYRKLFKKAFADQAIQGLNANTINRAIAAYLRSLVALDSPFDKYMRRETEALPEAAINGFNLFTGKAACATCHFAPLFNGTVPPRFLESESEVLGVPATADLAHAQLDTDPGRAGVIGADAWKHAFKTPTVRNAEITAPYMHNGVFTTLEEVIEFYDLGGGAGLNLDVPNQTLAPDPLRLTSQEKQDLIAFMHSLTDTSAAINAAPKSLPGFPKQSGLNTRPIGGTY